MLKDCVVDSNIDLLTLTETWLSPGNIDSVEIIGLIYALLVMILYIFHENLEEVVSTCFSGSAGLDIKCNSSVWNSSFQSFEFLDVRFKSSNVIRLIIIYRPPSSSPLTTFYDPADVRSSAGGFWSYVTR